MSQKRARLVFLGMDSVYSTRVLDALYQAGHDVCAIIKPFGGTESRRKRILTRSTYFAGVATRAVNKLTRRLPRADHNETDPFKVASLHGTPCWLAGNASAPKVRELIQSYQPELICIAFFNQLLRKKVLQIPPLGVINAHPSLLPAYRGPSPLFWMFYEGARVGGVSVHRVDQGEDSGAILQQEAVPIELGIGGPQYLDKLADVAARLVPRAVQDLVDGTAQERGQDPNQVSRHARPAYGDLCVRFHRSAEQVFFMVRGLSAWAPLWTFIDGQPYRVLDALEFEAKKKPPASSALVGERLIVRCQPGSVTLRVRPAEAPQLNLGQ